VALALQSAAEYAAEMSLPWVLGAVARVPAADEDLLRPIAAQDQTALRRLHDRLAEIASCSGHPLGRIKTRCRLALARLASLIEGGPR
jgi:hypothetical protein